MKFGERAFIVADPAVWHSLPTDIRTTSSPAFRKKLKTFLFLKFYDIIQTIRLLDLKKSHFIFVSGQVSASAAVSFIDISIALHYILHSFT